MLTQSQVVDQVGDLLKWRKKDAKRLDRIYKYIRGKQDIAGLPANTPEQTLALARVAKVNVLKYVVDAPVHALRVDGFRVTDTDNQAPSWDIWQRNGMDKDQVFIHREALTFGASYATVLPGDAGPVIKTHSPRFLTAVYGEDELWPLWALHFQYELPNGKRSYRLLDDEHAYTVEVDSRTRTIRYVDTKVHGVGECPVVRYTDCAELEGEVLGQVEPLTELQDQINLTTFHLLVAQHYSAHRQRYAIGWLAEDEAEATRAAASNLMTFEDETVKVGEFGQTILDGYIDSREATVRHVATISQTPVHELLGTLANLSAEALVAARDSHNRKVSEHQVVLGESHEQLLNLAGRIAGIPEDPTAWVRWRDTESRSLAQTADGLGKLVQMLGIPAQELWERVPNTTKQEIDSWKAAAAAGDPLLQLTSLLDGQASA